MNPNQTIKLFLTSIAVSACLVVVGGAQKQLPTTVDPKPRDGNWMQRHDSFNERVKKGSVDLLLIGDSITQGWEGAGKDAWKNTTASATP